MFRVVTFLVTVSVAICNAELEFETRPLPDGRIVGGSAASIRDFPHQVAMFYKGFYRCGGSLYSENIVITACVCVMNTDTSKLTIAAGASYLSELITEIPVERVIIHPQFKSYNNDYDVAILVLRDTFQFNLGIQPIALAKERPADGTLVTVTGWGVLQSGDADVPNQLQKVDVNVVSNADCRKVYSALLLTKRMLCAGVTGGGKDACQGDNGSPLIVNNQLLGIVSWGAGCARENYPGVYTSVPDLYEWIVETAQENAISVE